MSKLIIALAAYVVIGVLCAAWFDAMDRRYGVAEGAAPGGFVASGFMGLVWPFSLPIAMIAAATGGLGRWTLPAHPSEPTDA